MQCSRYDRLRSDLTPEIPHECFNVDTIFNGSKRFSSELNLIIQQVAQQFITSSGRF